MWLLPKRRNKLRDTYSNDDEKQFEIGREAHLRH